MRHICDKARDLIIFCEVTSKAYYEKKLLYPTWPKEESGVTIGIGHDLRFTKKADVDALWAALPDDQRDALKSVCGLGGEKARAALPHVAHIKVPWELAVAVFEQELVSYVAETLKAFPGSDNLSDPCFGVLVSLVFNRGAGMGVEGRPSWERRQEMRAIRDAIQAGDVAAVPDQLLSMRRLWPKTSGLYSRREREADLWKEGL